MNTQSIHWEECFNPSSAEPRHPAHTLRGYLAPVVRGLVAFATGLALLTVTIWTVSDPGLAIYMRAFTWSAGFVFLAVAIDTQRPTTAIAVLVTGITILLIAVLSTHTGAGITVVSSLLISAWLTVAIYRQ